MNNDDIQQQLKQLAKNYRAQLPERMEAIETCWRQICEHNHWKNEGKEIYRHVHSLAGSGASFGYFDMSKRAQAVELQLQALMERDGALTEQARQEVTQQLAQLKNELLDVVAGSSIKINE